MDINDYKDWGIIGLDQRAPNEIDWRGPYTNFRATRDSHFKALNEYFESSMVVTKIEDRQTLLDAYNVFFEKGRLFKPVASQFWNSLVSLPVTFNVGDVFDIGEDPQVVGQQLYPMPFNNGEEVQQFAYLSEGGEYIYTIYTEELHNEYISELGEVMLAEKQLFILIDGDTFEDYVDPTTTTTTTEATSTTTTTAAPSYYIYDFTSVSSNANAEFAADFNKAGVTNWDGTYRVVALNLNTGTEVYYIGTDGDKHLFTFKNGIGGGDPNNHIKWNETTIFDNVGSITFDSITPFVVTTTTTTTVSPIVSFTKANYGTDIDVVSPSLTLKRGNNKGLFNTNEGTTYDGTWYGGKNHLWCMANNGVNGAFDSYVDLWNTFDTSTIDIAQLQSDYEPYEPNIPTVSGFFNDKSMVPWTMVHNGTPLDMLNKEMIMLDVLDGKFYKVKFTQWTSGDAGGGLSYTRELFN